MFFSPTTNFLVGNYGLTRAERWEVGRYAEQVLRGGRDLSMFMYVLFCAFSWYFSVAILLELIG